MNEWNGDATDARRDHGKVRLYARGCNCDENVSQFRSIYKYNLTKLRQNSANGYKRWHLNYTHPQTRKWQLNCFKIIEKKLLPDHKVHINPDIKN